MTRIVIWYGLIYKKTILDPNMSTSLSRISDTIPARAACDELRPSTLTSVNKCPIYLHFGLQRLTSGPAAQSTFR